LCLKAKYEASTGVPSQQGVLLDQLKSLASSAADDAVVQLAVAQVLMAAGDLQAAYPMAAAVRKKLPEAWACQIQILLQWNRLDLAQQELKSFQSTFEESVVAELTNIYVQLFQGRTGGASAEHSITALSEQYGPSVYLLNLMAAAHGVQGDYAAAETKLQMATTDFNDSAQPETAVNTIAVNTHLHKPYDLNAVLLDKKSYTSLQFAEGWQRVTTAFDREAAKYKL
jgi:Coatomer epsilon subunit